MIDLLQLFLTHLQGYKRQAVWSPILIVVEVICELLLPLVTHTDAGNYRAYQFADGTISGYCSAYYYEIGRASCRERV